MNRRANQSNRRKPGCAQRTFFFRRIFRTVYMFVGILLVSRFTNRMRMAGMQQQSMRSPKRPTCRKQQRKQECKDRAILDAFFQFDLSVNSTKVLACLKLFLKIRSINEKALVWGNPKQALRHVYHFN